VHFTSGGSEATETAIKIVRQYWLSRGQPGRHQMFSRWQSYHGATLGALALSGNLRRRESYRPLLPEVSHISACFCYRCPLELEYPSCKLACAEELETAIVAAGKETVAAFILEPVVGATSGAVPPEGYLRTIREICDRHDILLIADEILTGAGRTGRYLAVEHWNVVPDIILLGKGLSSGYAPLGAVLVAEKVWKTIERGTSTLEHGFTYQGHPPSMAAGLAVQHYLEKHNLVDHAHERGTYLARELQKLRKLECVGDVRGKGLLQTVEFVRDREFRTPFPAEHSFIERLSASLRERGILVYPMRGTADGASGEHIMLAPPFVIEEAEIDLLVRELGEAIAAISAAL
jgi:adenosylmethionine-8-amino-7-oxononanoate aminotransferase